jgi:hypothetical protein
VSETGARAHVPKPIVGGILRLLNLLNYAHAVETAAAAKDMRRLEQIRLRFKRGGPLRTLRASASRRPDQTVAASHTGPTSTARSERGGTGAVPPRMPSSGPAQTRRRGPPASGRRVPSACRTSWAVSRVRSTLERGSTNGCTNRYQCKRYIPYCKYWSAYHRPVCRDAPVMPRCQICGFRKPYKLFAANQGAHACPNDPCPRPSL